MSKERQSSDEEEESILNEIMSEISTTVSSDISFIEKSLCDSRKNQEILLIIIQKESKL